MRVTIAVADTAFEWKKSDVLIVPFSGAGKIRINETAKQLILQSSGRDFLKHLAAYIRKAIVLEGEFIAFSKEKLLWYRDNPAHSARMLIPILLREAQFRNFHHIVIPLLRSRLLGLEHAAEDMISGLKQFFHFIQKDITVTVVLGRSQRNCLEYLQTQATHINNAEKPTHRTDGFWQKEVGE